MKNQDSLNKTISLKISKRQEVLLERFEKITGISKSKFIFLGVEPIICILKEMLNEAGGDTTAFYNALIKPTTMNIGGFTYKPLIDILPLKERIEFLISLETIKHNYKEKNRDEI